ncbi:MAG: DUF2197 domain-containing protein [Syntrophomonadaceae bacterium]|nr:DUF2197 domain-containing protein [Syntrophomonadaceae bacterium]MDD3022786.1 DUF2197 domain-containing protein [Syntrophomonadaceae bacterium]
MKSLSARCLLCGKNYDVEEDHKDFQKLSKQEKAPTFICDYCSNKVRHESDDKRKEKKPM